MNKPQSAFSDQVLAAADSGSKIQAIKIYREETGLGLKDAKDAIDALFIERRKDPRVAAGMVEEGGAGGMVKLLVTIAVILGAYFYFFAG